MLRNLLLSLALCMTLACGGSDPNREVVIYSSVDQVFSEPVFREFERQSGLKVRAVFDTEETKSTGVLNRLIAESAHPQADVFWSGDPVRPFLLIQRGLVEPYSSPQAAAIPEGFNAARGEWAGIAARARVLLVNPVRLQDRPAPRSIQDLTRPEWKAEGAIANPLFGTTTMHAAALFSAWGDAQAQSFFDSLKTNQVRIASSNGEVKRLVVEGEVTFGLTDTDDANEALKENPNLLVVYPDQEGMGTLVMPTTVVLMRGAPHPEAARQLVDFLLSAETERRMAQAAAHMPLRRGTAPLPQARAVETIKAMQVDYGQVAAAMERIQPWLRQWAGV